MKIADKINRIHEFVSTPAGAGKGIEIQGQASEAIKGGITSDAWKVFMSNFASNPAQLKRLLGQDSFIEKPWGLITLAYLPANAMCGTSTTANTGRNVPPPMMDALDGDGLDPSDDTSFPNQPEHLSVAEFV